MFDKQNPQEARGRDASENPGGSEGRRRAQRSGREKGLRVFIPAAVLEAAGVTLDGELPAYALQAVKEPGRSRRSVIVRLYVGD